jgi:Putative TM nitroreductase
MTPLQAQAFPVALTEMPAAEWAAAVVVRRSARTYTGKTVVAAELQRLERLCESLPAPEAARVVVLREVPGSVFTGFVGSYGRVLKAPSALLMIGTETAPSFPESVGYLGEAAVLEATSMGLGTCWVAGFFDKALASKLVPLAPKERVLAISPLGYAAPRPRAGERLMKRAVGAHKRRAVEEVAPEFDEERWPAWAAEGVRLARAAPSAVNRQPWKFELAWETDRPGLYPESARSAHGVTISVVVRGLEGNIPRRLDCGIAMLHFEVGARLMGAPGSWESLDDPQVARYRVAETPDGSSVG